MPEPTWLFVLFLVFAVVTLAAPLFIFRDAMGRCFGYCVVSFLWQMVAVAARLVS